MGERKADRINMFDDREGKRFIEREKSRQAFIRTSRQKRIVKKKKETLRDRERMGRRKR